MEAKRLIVFLLVLSICLFTGCATEPPSSTVPQTTAAPQGVTILSPMAAGSILPTVELSDGVMEFEDAVPPPSTMSIAVPEQGVRYTYDYDEITERLGLDLIDVFSRSGLPEYLQPTEEDFLYDGFLLKKDAPSYGTSGKNSEGTIFGGIEFELSEQVFSGFHAKLIVRASLEGEYIDFSPGIGPGLYSEKYMTYTSTVGNIPVSMNYAYSDTSLGYECLEFFATFSVSGYRYGVFSSGLCSQEDFINVVLTIINAYQAKTG